MSYCKAKSPRERRSNVGILWEGMWKRSKKRSTLSYCKAKSPRERRSNVGILWEGT